MNSNDRFLNLCTDLEIPRDASVGVWNRLFQRYSEPHRSYHNLRHVNSMLDELDRVMQGGVAMELAIWFHDVIYDPKSKDNETRSAEFFEACMGGIVAAPLADEVVRLIEATDYSRERSGRQDEDLIRDIDLSVLAADPADYLAYCSAIRAEYSHVTDPDFVVGRLAILKRLSVSPIYFTDHFLELEEAASRNIDSEIKRLETGVSGLL